MRGVHRGAAGGAGGAGCIRAAGRRPPAAGRARAVCAAGPGPHA